MVIICGIADNLSGEVAFCLIFFDSAGEMEQ